MIMKRKDFCHTNFLTTYSLLPMKSFFGLVVSDVICYNMLVRFIIQYSLSNSNGLILSIN